MEKQCFSKFEKKLLKNRYDYFITRKKSLNKILHKCYYLTSHFPADFLQTLSRQFIKYVFDPYNYRPFTIVADFRRKLRLHGNSPFIYQSLDLSFRAVFFEHGNSFFI